MQEVGSEFQKVAPEKRQGMHSGQLDATVRLTRGESEITKNKQPWVPQEACILLAPFPVALSGLRWGMPAVRDERWKEVEALTLSRAH